MTIPEPGTLPRLPQDIFNMEKEDRDFIETSEDKAHALVKEPLVYQRHIERSYFVDLARSGLQGDSAAGERLERHTRQMEAIPRQETRTYPGTNMEYRVTPNLESGHGLEFTVPAWMNEYFATARRPGEIIQRLVREKGNEFELPSGVSSIAVPRLTTGTVVNSQTPNAPVENEDVVTAEVKAQALVYSGESDWSLQGMEQSPAGAHLDWAMFKDLGESLDAEYEKDLIAGRGETLNEALGLTEISGINGVTYTDGAPSAVKLFPELGKAAAQSGAKRKLPPTAWLMTTGRFFWLAFGEDSSNRPLSIEDYPESDWPNAGLGSVGVYLDDAISIELTAGKVLPAGEQDVVIACRPEDWLLWHSSPRTAVMEEPLSGTLGVRFLLYRTTATMLHRYPSSISVVSGTGLKVQTGFK